MQTLKHILTRFFDWYKRNFKINLSITAFLFAWQLVHLYWMTTNIVGFRLFGREFWDVGRAGNIAISVVDYTEIPAIILSSVFYIGELRKSFNWKGVLFLIFLNLQWLHIFWITDEIVVEQITGTALIMLPLWLSWIAILIDYLELPVIYDTIKKAIRVLRNKSV
jgi:hypothetical protein